MSHHTLEDQLKILDDWLQAEEDTIAMTSKISSATKNPVIKIFMDVIRTDSAKHKRIQEFLKSTMTEAAVNVSFDEIGEISGMINGHLALEQKTVDMAKNLVAETKLPVQKELIEYLLEDEQKHVKLLNSLAEFKSFAIKNT